MTLTGVEGARSELGRSLLERKHLSADWLPAFAAVPRSAFLPDVVWPFDMDTGATVAVDRRDEPDLWSSYADADVPIVTQWDDGVGEGRGSVPTSSASMPSVVFRMLSALEVEAGHRVLEIGTGTGWNSALLAHRLGVENVVSIEIDPCVADAARDRLAARQLLGRVLARDGEDGEEMGAPYDRIIATAGVRQVPRAWLRDAPGGVILVPWGTHLGNGDALVRLRVSEDGGSAEGRFLGPVEFMKVRGQRSPFAGHDVYVPDGVAGAARSTTAVTEEQLLGGDRFAAQRFAVGLMVRNCYQQVADRRGGARPVWFYGLTDRSWACVMFQEGRAEAVVWQFGHRRLWDEVATALAWWRAAGEPGYGRFGLTVTAQGQRAWLDRPAGSWEV
ncbi:methyltransferase domain-containing protein [Streptomyces sp. CMSTAAHL-2]|uniref:methyltransferase domain-containing protein n=1 Tax=Streptomyces sp. CMSTAAHL-2 TaxID=2904522 RepID=UPI001E627149|nr:methyltransferase domain-containing protein [Streptomyces sp. CMSTAAHL-2]MCE3030416.1 methyltransferase domain-containing protein [Streptomyces sp. CMSTAAHL-2]